MNHSIFYSFVLPAYKARFFKEAIDSILAQTYTNFELVIVNDASPQDLDSIVHSYDDSRIRYYVNEKNIGGKDLVAQWNHCLEYAKGDYIILASDDDVYHPEYLEKMDALVVKYPEVNVFRPRVQHIDAEGNIILVAGFLKEYTSQLELAYFLVPVSKGIPFYLFKKQVLTEMGGFVNYPLAWHSDDMTVIRMAEKGVVFCSDILFSFRYSGESITTKTNDTITLSIKVDATNRYYADYHTLLQCANPQSETDKFYRRKLIENLPAARRSDLHSWFWCSSKTAVIKCFRLYRKCGCFSIRMLFGMYARKICR